MLQFIFHNPRANVSLNVKCYISYNYNPPTSRQSTTKHTHTLRLRFNHRPHTGECAARQNAFVAQSRRRRWPHEIEAKCCGIVALRNSAHIIWSKAEGTNKADAAENRFWFPLYNIRMFLQFFANAIITKSND